MALMEPYIGNAGDKVQIPVRTKSNVFADGSNNYLSKGETYMGFKICVEYEYEAPFCINGSKVNDCTDEGLAGWTINLKNAAGAVIATDDDRCRRQVLILRSAPGSYTVCEVMQAGWKNVGDTCIPVDPGRC